VLVIASGIPRGLEVPDLEARGIDPSQKTMRQEARRAAISPGPLPALAIPVPCADSRSGPGCYTVEVTPLAALVDTLGKTLAGREGIQLALLFGSRARGEERPDSDADVAILGNDLDGNDLDLLGLAADLSAAAGREVDVVALAHASYPMMRALLRDAIVVYEGHPGAAADWRTRAILATETDRPWFERMRDAYLEHLAAGGHG
jgi:predicted nucleotidyltransferase